MVEASSSLLLTILKSFNLLIGHFLLTYLLLDNMKKTARKSKREGRIVNVSSEAHRYSYREGIRFDKIDPQSAARVQIMNLTVIFNRPEC